MSLFALALLFVPFVSILAHALRDRLIRSAGLAGQVSRAPAEFAVFCAAFCVVHAALGEQPPQRFRGIEVIKVRVFGKGDGPHLIASLLWNENII